MRDVEQETSALKGDPMTNPNPQQQKDELKDAFLDWFAESDAHVNTKQERDQLEAAFNAGVAFACQSAASRDEVIDEVLAIVGKYAAPDNPRTSGEAVARGILAAVLALKTPKERG
jgi:hypothetical protein